MIYLKTIFSNPSEYPFLILNLLESYDNIDYMLITEANRTHTGAEREYIFDINHLPLEKRDKVKYIKIDISNESVFSPENEAQCHSVNEKHIRGSFTRYTELHDEDIIFSVDADEVIYSGMYSRLISAVESQTIVKLKLHQFFYKINYLWKNNIFIAPTAAKYHAYRNSYPAHWRYDGNLYPEIVGCHFSWCMPIRDLLVKMKNYAHAPAVSHLATREILEKAIITKTYPFDPNREFIIKELDYSKDSHYYPPSLLENQTIFSPEVL